MRENAARPEAALAGGGIARIGDGRDAPAVDDLVAADKGAQVPDYGGHVGKPAAVAGVRGQTRAAQLAWGCLITALLGCAVLYAGVAVSAVRFPFGLDYSEGLVWQQALWLGTPKLYGDIAKFPFLVCEYPPLFLVALRAVGASGVDMLAGGRALSIICLVVSGVLLGALTVRACRAAGCGRGSVAAAVAALLPLTLLPVMSWSFLMRVDMMALALSLAGLYCAVVSFRRPGAIFAAVGFFVAAAFTKQIYLAAAASAFAVCVLRDPRRTLLAYGIGGAVGLSALGGLELATQGRFLKHVFVYTADVIEWRRAIEAVGQWLAAYPIDAAMVGVSVGVAWRAAARDGVSVARLRRDEGFAILVLLSVYLLLTTAMLVAAGKTGASRNYFIEWMAVWCVWIGWLCGRPTSAAAGTAFRLPAWVAPALLLLQLVPVFAGLRTMQSETFSAQRRQDWAALLARVRAIPGPLLSDDMVLTIRAGREVGLEPGVLLELSRLGLWDERRLTDKLRAHYFGAVITAYDAGDPTFDIRYLPATYAALMTGYPHVEKFGDYRLRVAE